MAEHKIKKSIVLKRCPACERQYTGALVVCQHDGTLLMPVQRNPKPEFIGMVIAQRYEVQQVLHLAPTSVCLLVKDRENPETARALKLMQGADGAAGEARMIERFLRQVERQERLDHKNVVRVIGHGEDEDHRQFIVFELVDGYSLAKAKRALQNLPLAYLLEAISQTCDALEYATEHGVVHNDLSPNDILICSDDHQLLTVKVTDFAKGQPLIHADNRSQQLTECGDIFGTPEHMSPEACFRQELDARSNVYSLGCIMLTQLSIGNPLTREHWGAVMLAKLEPRAIILNMPELEANVTEALMNIIYRCMEQKPEKRYQTLAQLKSELQTLYAKGQQLPFTRVREAFEG